MPTATQHHSFLEYRRYLFLKLAALLVAVSTLAYFWQQPASSRYGGSVSGYVLGTVAALLVLILMWFGVRKRQYQNSVGTLKGWLSAHVYLGLSLVFVASLHSAFEMGWNLHTLCYLLMLAVVASGFYGVYAYVRFPRLLTLAMGEDTLDSLFLKIADLDRQARHIAMQLPDEINGLVLAAAQETQIGGGVLRQLRRRQPNCPTARAVDRLQQLGRSLDSESAQLNRELYALMLRKADFVQRAREDVMYRARMQVWLYFHVPLAVAMLAALVAHVLSVFFYW
ncbi:MAG: hypothetical protein ABIW30_03555 [Arenimonas sp.]